VTLQNIDQYGPSFQLKVIAALLNSKKFLTNIHDIISDEYFNNQAHKWIVKEIIKYYNKYHTTPTLEVLKVELKKIQNEVLQISVKEQLREAYKESDDLEYVEEEFSSFCKNQILKKALLNSVDLLQVNDYDSIKLTIESALRAGQDKNMGHEYNKDIETRYREEHRIVIPTPWNDFNILLQGGLGNGDFGLIFGNPGGGKSWALVALGAHAIELGYNVNHYTLELGEDYIGRRYDACFTRIPVNNIIENKNKVIPKVEGLKGNLVIKEYSPGKASLSTIESHIKKCIELGHKPDLIIIDYVDLLRSRRSSTERKHEIDDVYTGTKGLARELNIPVWSVSQVNRAGAKDDIIEGDKAAGSYDKIMIVDFAMSLSRKREDKVNGTGRFHIMKNRYGGDGLTFGSKIDTSMGVFEIISDDELESITPSAKPGEVSDREKSYLRQQQQFFLNP
jgi:replicative DNA helicase